MDELKFKNGKFTINGNEILSDSSVSAISDAVDSISEKTEQFSVIDNSEWLSVTTDAEGKIVFGVRGDGSMIPNYQEKISLLNTKTEKNESEIKSIKNIDNEFLFLPDYYEPYITEKITTIKSEIQSASTNSDIFIWMTDIHWNCGMNAQKSPALIYKLAKEVGISRILIGGDDTEDGNYDAECDLMWKLRKALGTDDIYSVYGNHEYINYVNHDYLFNCLHNHNRNIVYGDNEKTCFYVDNKEQKMRYIGLGSYGIRVPNSGYTSLYDDNRLEWFKNTALNVESGWHIIIFAHTIFTIVQHTDVLIPKWDEETQSWDKIPLTNVDKFINAIDTYKSNGGLGTIACVLIGHTHTDRLHTGKTGIPYIITASDRNVPCYSYGVSDIKNDRSIGTRNEQHFEVVIVDKTAKKIKLFSIGAPAMDGWDDEIGEETEYREMTF